MPITWQAQGMLKTSLAGFETVLKWGTLGMLKTTEGGAQTLGKVGNSGNICEETNHELKFLFLLGLIFSCSGARPVMTGRQSLAVEGDSYDVGHGSVC